MIFTPKGQRVSQAEERLAMLFKSLTLTRRLGGSGYTLNCRFSQKSEKSWSLSVPPYARIS